MSLIYQDQFEALRVELGHSFTRYETPDRGDGDVRSARSMTIPHLNVNGLAWVGICTMPSCLLNKLSSVDKYQSLCGMGSWRFYPIDELCKDDPRLS